VVLLLADKLKDVCPDEVTETECFPSLMLDGKATVKFKGLASLFVTVKLVELTVLVNAAGVDTAKFNANTGVTSKIANKDTKSGFKIFPFIFV
jgi:hypothetical protein